MVGCAKEYDDTALKSKVDALSSDVNTLKAQQKAMQAVIDVWKAGGYIANIDDSVPGQHTITFYGDNGKVVVLYDGEDGEQGPAGEDGDAYFKSIVTDENGVTFTLNDEEGTSFTIPFAKAFKLVINNLEAEVEAGKAVEFPYEIQNANATTTVDVFAGGNYVAAVNATENKIVVTPPTPAVNGSVLAWAQNEEGLFSMKKLSFIVKANTEVTTTQEELEAIPSEANEFVVNVVSNIDIDVEKPTVDWVSVVVTKADYKLTLTLAENTTGAPRETEIIVVRKDNGAQVQKIKIVQLFKELTIKNLYVKTTDADGIWCKDFTTSSDFRNIAMDDQYVYLAEFNNTKNIWALTLTDPSKSKKLPVETVESASSFSVYTSCPRVMKNTDANINGGKDVLLVSNLSEGGNYKLYVYGEGIDKNPSVINLSGAGRLGDTFTTTGTFSKGILFFAKNAGNGVVTFQMNGVTIGTRALVNRLAMTTDAACAYYPFPENFTSGILAKRSESRAVHEVVNATETQIWNTWDTAFTVTETQVEYAEGRNGSLEGYNFVEFGGKRYVIYGKRQSAKEGRVYILEGELTDDWLKIINTAAVKFRRDFTCTSGNGSSHSGLDVTARVIGNELYIAAVYQHVGLGVWKLLYE